VHDGSYVEPHRVTVNSFLEDEWLPSMHSKVDGNTWDYYETNVRAYIVPRIGKVQLQKLNAARMEKLYADLLVDGKRDGTGLAPSSVGKVHRTLHRALRDAARLGRIPRNYVTDAEPPRAKRARVAPWNGEQVRTFLDAAAEHDLFACWLLVATAGLRREEVLGLRWSDVDLDAGHLSVVQVNTYVHGKPTLKPAPKSEHSARFVAVEPLTLAALRSHRARQSAAKLAADEYLDLDLVFAGEQGTPLYPATVTRAFVKVARGAKLLIGPRPLHGLRHSFATLALGAGVPTRS
jgi:integrase